MTQEPKQRLPWQWTILSLWFISIASLILFAFTLKLYNLEVKAHNDTKWRYNHILDTYTTNLETDLHNCYTFQEQYFYPDDIYRKLQEEGMPDSLARMFTQVAIRESFWGLNSNLAKSHHNYWGRRDTLDNKEWMYFETNEDACRYMAKNFSKCPNKDKYKWLKEDLRWCPGCKSYYKEVKSIEF